MDEAVRSFDAGVTLTRAGIGAPIFYTVDRGRVRVSSRLQPLISALGRRPSVEVSRLPSLLVNRAPDDPSATVYEGVYRVPTHHSVRVDVHGHRQAIELALELEPLEGIEAEEAIREFRQRFLNVVRRHITGRRRVAVLVGGGVDSSAVLGAAIAAARGATATEVLAVALHFASRGDDRPYLRALVDSLGIVPVHVAPASGGAHMRAVMNVDAAPLTSAISGCEAALLIAARERGAEIALSGAGGDDLLDGNPYVLADSWHEGDVLQTAREASRLRVYWREPGPTQIWDFAIRPLLVRQLPRTLRALWRKGRQTLPWAGPELSAFLEREVSRFDGPPPRSAAARYAHFVTFGQLREAVDARAQISLYSGLERVDPFLDDELLRFVCSLPPRLLFHGGRTRAILRHAVEGWVPDAVRWRTDKAWFEPAMAEAVVAAGGFSIFDDLANVSRLHRLGLVEPGPFREAFSALAADPEGFAHGWIQLWPALATEAFLAAHDRLDP